MGRNLKGSNPGFIYKFGNCAYTHLASAIYILRLKINNVFFGNNGTYSTFPICKIQLVKRVIEAL